MGGQAWQIWLTAIVTLGIYTFLYADNRLYRFLLSVMIGLNVGYALVITWIEVLQPKWWDLAWGGFQPHLPHSRNWMLVAIGWLGALSAYVGSHPWAFVYWFILGFLGLLWYFQLSRKYLWLSRIVIGMTLGAGAGVVFKAQLLVNAPQITDSFRPIPARGDGSGLIGGTGPVDFLPSLVASLNNVIFIVTIVCVMVYFFFSFSHERPAIRGAAKAGRWLLMISFGAFFGNAIMTRMAIFLERVQFLVNDWARNREVMTWPWVLGALGLVLVIAAVYFFTRPRPGPPAPELAAQETAPVLER